MKAALYQGQGKIEMTTLPDPVCTDDGVILQNIYASICGTDVAVYTHGTGLGHKITIGGEFGHEVVCRIKEKGKNVQRLSVGDRVYPYPRLVTGDTKRAGTIGGFSERPSGICAAWRKILKRRNGWRNFSRVYERKSLRAPAC